MHLPRLPARDAGVLTFSAMLACAPTAVLAAAALPPGKRSLRRHKVLDERPSEYGANLRNGICYQLELTAQGRVGRPQGIALNDVSAPPDDPSVAPFSPELRLDMEAGSPWTERLSIE